LGAAPPHDEDRRRLAADLIDTFFTSYADLAAGSGEGYVPLDEGVAEEQLAGQLGVDLGVVDLAAGARAEEASQLAPEGASALGRLPLERAERPELTLRGDHLLDGVDPEGADQLVLEVGDADEEAESFQIGAGEPGPEADAFEVAPKVPLLTDVAEARQPQIGASGTEQVEVVPDVGRAAHRHDGHAFRVEVAAVAVGERFECELVAPALDEDRGVHTGVEELRVSGHVPA
jgi:hypothetical protein